MAVNINVPSQVRTFANLAAFPASGAVKTIYIAEDTNKTYRWDGSTYVEISASAATSLTIGTTPISSGTIGRVLFQGTGNVLQQSSSLAYDDSTKAFSLIANQNAATALSITNNSTGSSAVITSTLFSSNAIGNSILYGSGRVNDNANQYQTGASYIIDYQGPVGLNLASTFASGGNSGIRFWTAAGTNNGIERMRISSGGNVLINTTTDAGFRLDVNGTARVTNLNVNLSTGSIPFMGASGLVTQNNANLFWDNTNARLGIGTATPLDRLHISTNGNNIVRLSSNPTNANIISFRDIDGTGQGAFLATGSTFSYGTYRSAQTNLSGGIGGIGLRTSNGANAHISFYSGNADADLSTERMRLVASTGNVLINTLTDAGFKLDVNGTARVTSVTAGNGLVGTWATSGNFARFGHTGHNAPTNFGFLQESNGNSYMNGTSSYIGAANNIIFDTNAVEKMRITLGGNVLIGTATAGASKLRVVGLPTSSAGLSAGDIWNDAGTLKIV
jgi:hypothetical protein